MKTFDEYFAEYQNYDKGGKLDKMIIADAKKVFEALGTLSAIEEFENADSAEQNKLVKGLDDGHSGFSFGSVLKCATDYAVYVEQEKDLEQRKDSIKNGIYTSVVRDMLDKYRHVVTELARTKFDGNRLFNASEINDILVQCQDTIIKNPDRIWSILDNPEEMVDIAGWRNKGAGLWRALKDPMSSTVAKNPELWREDNATDPEPKKGEVKEVKSSSDKDKNVKNAAVLDAMRGPRE